MAQVETYESDFQSGSKAQSRWKTIVDAAVNANAAGNGTAIDISGFGRISMEVENKTGAHVVHVMKAQVSVNLGVWKDAHMSGAGEEFVANVTSSHFKWLRWQNSTAEGGASTVDVTFHCERY